MHVYNINKLSSYSDKWIDNSIPSAASLANNALQIISN
jgi:hypothetical protein